MPYAKTFEDDDDTAIVWCYGLDTESKLLAEINEKYFVVMDGARTRYSILTNSLIRCTMARLK